MPKCASCQYGKQVRRAEPGKTTLTIKDQAGILRADNLAPGQRVSVDHFVCSTRGRLFSSRGKLSYDEMFAGGCIFVDHASSYIHVEFQTNLTTHATLQAKEAYEWMCCNHSVVPQS